MMSAIPSVLHLLQGLRIGGMEKGTLQLATRARRLGADHRLAVFDSCFRDTDQDFDPGIVPVTFVRRRAGTDFRFPFSLASTIDEWKPQIIHTRNATALFYASIAVQLLKPKPRLIGTFDTYPSHATRSARLATHFASVFADALTAVSDELCSRLTKERWLTRCEVIWNGVDTDEFSPCGLRMGVRTMLHVPEDYILVAHIGRFDTIKRHIDLVKAVDILKSLSIPEFRVIMVGDGPTRSQIQALTAGSDIEFLTSIRDVAAFLRESDILVLCSEHEAAPRVLLEAMAVGVPVIATGVGGIPTMLCANGDTCGIIIPPARPDALANAISKLATSPVLRRRLADRARSRVLSTFTADREWSEYAAIYRRVMYPTTEQRLRM
ncbi:MAG: glycosyltransferase family 4 protein [Gammaproteobacteria bacterium]|nr:glycosyltransferase family 4 protein [Gammaproteobacteria bacterium]